ncbi:MAG: 50S ribosomal protein L3 [Bryobacteraceae bacterium]
MVNGIVGKKLGMTQVFDEAGRLVPVTVIEAGPCVVTQVKTVEKDGYEGVQVAFGDVKEKRVNKPLKGHFAKNGVQPKRYLRELPVDGIEGIQPGQVIRADVFGIGDFVKVTGVSKGKGFAGAVKRWHFHGADMTHGSMIHRKPQSGGATDAARTFKGVKRPGRMGGDTVTQRGLMVHRVDPERNLILIKGAVPGANGGLVLIARQLVGG